MRLPSGFNLQLLLEHPMEHFDFTPGILLDSLTVTDLTVEGGAVARHEGRVVFLDAGLPGEVVRAEVTAVRKKIVQARRVETLEPSPWAAEPWCPHAAECGGCPLQGFAPEGRLAWKENHVRQTLARIGKVRDLPVSPILPSPKERCGRIRVAYAFGRDDAGAFTLGLRRRGSREVVAVHECGLQIPEAGEILRRVREALPSLVLPGGRPLEHYLCRLILHTPEHRPADAPLVVTECLTLPQKRPGERDALWDFLRRILGEDARFVHSETRDPALSRAEGIVRSNGPAEFQEAYGDRVLEFPVTAFAQTNTGAAESLYRLVAEKAELTGRETVWDIYCGVGSIGLYLAPAASAVFGCDGLGAAVEAAGANAERLGFARCAFAAGSLPELLEARARLETPDVVVLDPPRVGLEEGVRAFLRTLRARRLIYVSCDAASQARDLAALEGAWRAVSAHPVDMFPTAAHVENVLILERV